MPAALPFEVRAEIVRRRERRESLRSISQEMGLAYDTVRQIWQHWQTRGTLTPNYAACRHPGIRKPVAVYEAALALRRQHPRWGAVVIRLYLLDEFEADAVPGERTLQTWFRRASLSRCPPVRRRQAGVRRGQAVHDVWAVDAKAHLHLEDGSEASWLTISEEASGAILDSQVFPPRDLGAGGPEPGQAAPADGLRTVGTPAHDPL